jgi:hypothetical protein
MDVGQFETMSATIAHGNHVRVQIPTDDVSAVLDAVVELSSLRYGSYEQVAFTTNAGSQQFKPLEGSKPGDTDLITISCNEISFTVPKNDETVAAVIEAIFQSHPYEEPVILIQEVMSTRFKYGKTEDNRRK